MTAVPLPVTPSLMRKGIWPPFLVGLARQLGLPGLSGLPSRRAAEEAAQCGGRTAGEPACEAAMDWDAGLATRLVVDVRRQRV